MTKGIYIAEFPDGVLSKERNPRYRKIKMEITKIVLLTIAAALFFYTRKSLISYGFWNLRY